MLGQTILRPADNSTNSNNALAVGASVVAAMGATALVLRKWQQQQSFGSNENSDNHHNHHNHDLNLSRKGQREVEKKQRLAAKHHEQQQKVHHQANKTMSNDMVPPSNFETSQWIVTDLSIPTARFSADYRHEESEWKLTLKYNEVTVTITAHELMQLPGYRQYKPVSWHCVTGWSKHGLSFWGVSLQEIITSFLPAGDNNNWKWLYQTCADGYTCPIARQDCLHSTAFLALKQQQQRLLPDSDQSQLPPEWIDMKHGGPRIIIPHLWGWKSAKWTYQWELLTEYKPGFWENIICHPRGRVFDPETRVVILHERWKSMRLGKVADFLTGCANLYHALFGPQVYEFVLERGGKILGHAKNAFHL